MTPDDFTDDERAFLAHHQVPADQAAEVVTFRRYLADRRHLAADDPEAFSERWSAYERGGDPEVSANDPNRRHATMTTLAAHERLFAALPPVDQVRHLTRQHGVRGDRLAEELELLARDEPDQYALRAPTLADVHEWWHVRQRRSVERQLDS